MGLRTVRAKRRAKGPKRLKDGSVPEFTIQSEILRWLESTELLSWRQSAGEIFTHGRKVSLGPVGISDIIVIVPPTGRILGLEVKSANGTLRPVQRQFKAKLEASGGLYEVVRSLGQAQSVVAEAIGGEALGNRPEVGTWRQRQQSGGKTTKDTNRSYGPS